MKHSAIQTALTAAAARAAHLIVDGEPTIFADPLASRLLGADADRLLAFHRQHGDHPILAGARAQVTLRSRIAEEVALTAPQYVLLGAGLDSFAYRTDRRVFEVDQPASQADKRARLAAAGITSPNTVTYVPLDLAGVAGRIVAALVEAGFDVERPAVVAWLGVTMYLSAEDVAGTLAELGGALAPGSAVVFDYMLAPELRDEAGQLYAEQVGAVAAQGGEPWRSAFAPEEMASLLTQCGFSSVDQFDQATATTPDIWDRADALRPSRLSMIVHATFGVESR